MTITLPQELLISFTPNVYIYTDNYSKKEAGLCVWFLVENNLASILHKNGIWTDHRAML